MSLGRLSARRGGHTALMGGPPVPVPGHTGGLSQRREGIWPLPMANAALQARHVGSSPPGQMKHVHSSSRRLVGSEWINAFSSLEDQGKKYIWSILTKYLKMKIFAIPDCGFGGDGFKYAVLIWFRTF